MERLHEVLAAKAIAVVPGPGYNAFLGQHHERGLVRSPPLFFEAALPEVLPEKTLADAVVPSFARFLHRKKQNLERLSNVLVALFLGDTCFVLPAEALFDLYCEIEGITRLGLYFRAQTWRD